MTASGTSGETSDPVEQPLRLALIGWGAIGRTTERLLRQSPVEVVAVGVRDPATERPELPASARLITDPEQLIQTRPDVVAEAAGRESVGPWGRAALAAGADLIVSSMSAFAEADLLEELRQLAVANRSQLLLQPGALGGIDALAAARAMGIDAVEHRIVKPPAAWRGTPAERLCDLDGLLEPTEIFRSNAAGAATAFPKNANVAMTTALAGIGPDATGVTLVADPAATTNRHEVTAHGPFGRLELSISNSPLPDNPKTSAMAALNLVRAIQNRNAAIVI